MNNFKRTHRQANEDVQNNNPLLKISQNELGCKFRSKQDLYSYLTQNLNLYLPPLDSVNKEFVRQVLQNHKKVFQMKEVSFIKVPKYEELSVKLLYPQAIEDEEVSQYLPDMRGKCKPLDRSFFFNILNTMQPDYVQKLITHALNLRHSQTTNEEKKDYILIADEWYQKLMTHPFISKRPGKTIHLLKESNKLIKQRKSKTKQSLATSLKRFKVDSKSSNNLDVEEIKVDQTQQDHLEGINELGKEENEVYQFNI